jgi:hypothetical protein
MKRPFQHYFIFLIFILAYFSSCNSIHVKSIGNGFQTWYGRVNNWNDLATTREEIAACHKYGVDGYMIELAGCKGEPDNQWTKTWLKDTEQNYKQLVKACRINHLWLFVSIVNDNMGQHKYGDKQPKLEQVMPMAQQLAQIVKKYGHKNIIVQPVAETQTASGEYFQSYCIQELKDFPLVYNGNAGWPTESIHGMSYIAVHPGDINDNIPAGAFTISDNGSIIRQLSINDSYDGKANPQTLIKWATHVKSCHSPIAGYYAFQRHDFDPDAIKALGKVK